MIVAAKPTRMRLWASALAAAGLLIACTPQDLDDAPVEVCRDPATTCVLSNGMSLQTRGTPRTLSPIELSVRDVPVSVTEVRVEASMSGMEMLPVGVVLRNSGPSEWTGQLILPVCSRGRSDWRWTLVTRVGSGVQRTTVAVEAAPP